MSEWHDMLAQAKALGINTHGLKKPELVAALEAAKVEQSTDAPEYGVNPALLEELAAQTETPAHYDLTALPIARTNQFEHWWCPYCDHSQTKFITDCRGCGATRDGDKVVKS